MSYTLQYSSLLRPISLVDHEPRTLLRFPVLDNVSHLRFTQVIPRTV